MWCKFFVYVLWILCFHCFSESAAFWYNKWSSIVHLESAVVYLGVDRLFFIFFLLIILLISLFPRCLCWYHAHFHYDIWGSRSQDLLSAHTFYQCSLKPIVDNQLSSALSFSSILIYFENIWMKVAVSDFTHMII